MHDPDTLKRTLLPLGFFAALLAILILGESLGPTQATIAIQNGKQPQVHMVPEPEMLLPTCKKNEDCPLPTSICEGGYCVMLQHPFCDCSKPKVLRCAEDSGKARFVYCRKACVETGLGAICQ